MKTLWKEASSRSRAKIIAIFVILFVIGFGLGMRQGSSRIESAMPSAKINPDLPGYVVYECDGGKSIWAMFATSSVSLSLSDGSSASLEHATSGSGARYANGDESYVFWDKGGDAFVERDGERIYEDCEVK